MSNQIEFVVDRRKDCRRLRLSGEFPRGWSAAGAADAQGTTRDAGREGPMAGPLLQEHALSYCRGCTSSGLAGAGDVRAVGSGRGQWTVDSGQSAESSTEYAQSHPADFIVHPSSFIVSSHPSSLIPHPSSFIPSSLSRARCPQRGAERGSHRPSPQQAHAERPGAGQRRRIGPGPPRVTAFHHQSATMPQPSPPTRSGRFSSVTSQASQRGGKPAARSRASSRGAPARFATARRPDDRAQEQSQPPALELESRCSAPPERRQPL